MSMLCFACAKSPVKRLNESRLLDPVKAGCTCPDLDLSQFQLIGNEKLAKKNELLNECRAKLLIENIQE